MHDNPTILTPVIVIIVTAAGYMVLVGSVEYQISGKMPLFFLSIASTLFFFAYLMAGNMVCGALDSRPTFHG